ncbi:helix-turn-helix transcriptional regulator [Mycoplasmatota bacterium]|nr:helix-turn-helix transcriptional regulator [Mycoplasmatota bacterium]
MEFCEKLQQFRKQKDMTQKQLAEQLFVSRTAISKWESGKGYPNIESLKSISKLFSVSIDDLLSGEELINLAASENRSNMGEVLSLIYGILDLMAIVFIFLPFYGQLDGEFIRSVTLFAYHDVSAMTRTLYFALLIMMSVLGIAELIIQFFENEKGLNISKTCSVILHALAIMLFVLTRQPYVTSFLFMFFMIKIVLLIKSSKIK